MGLVIMGCWAVPDFELFDVLFLVAAMAKD